MIIPVRCFTCHKVIGDKWEYFKRKTEEHTNKTRNARVSTEDIRVDNEHEIYFTNRYPGEVLDELGLTKMCCRRHMLSHIDLVDVI